HPRERVDRGGGRLPRVGLHAGGDSAVRRRVHRGLREAAPRTPRRRSRRAGAADAAVNAGQEGQEGRERKNDRLRIQAGTFDSARMIASVNIGTSSGLRDVIRLPSSTTGLSTYKPPAFLTSIAIDGQHVSVRPRSTSAEIRTCGPWQMAATGLPESIASRARSTIAWRMRILSGAWPPGITSASKSAMRADPAAMSDV